MTKAKNTPGGGWKYVLSVSMNVRIVRAAIDMRAFLELVDYETLLQFPAYK